MSTKLDLDVLLEANAAGGAAHLVITTEMAPAAGGFAAIAPAKFATAAGAAYAFESRWIDGAAVRCVLVDSKSSQLNRVEECLSQAIGQEHPVLSRLPRVQVRYAATDGHPEAFVTDLDLSHRLTDGHVRAGQVDGASVTLHPKYVAARNVQNSDVTPIMELAPSPLFLGGWDSTRKSHQTRFPSALTGEIIAVVADQVSEHPEARHSGARVDAVAASTQLSGKVFKSLAEAQGSELSPKLLQKISKVKDAAIQSGSPLGLGSIPPGLNDLAGVAASRIIRSHVLSFATLRRLRFGGTPERDNAARALLAAVALRGLVASYEDGFIRANCHLVELEEPRFELKGRFGKTIPLEPLTVDDADALLQQAYDLAAEHGIDWHGQVFEVEGNPEVLRGADNVDAEGSEA